MSLRERLVAQIVVHGPLSVADYMRICLYDPEHGYYATHPRLGAGGDFVTAPHLSQMFGEVLGLWAVDAWTRLGQPPLCRLVELGPGDGVMMRDILHATRIAPGFQRAIEVRLMESSGPLRAAQGSTLSGAALKWADDLDGLPTDAPIILLANEFLDCLPIQQHVLVGERMLERRVGLDAGGRLAFTVTEAGCSGAPPRALAGPVLETSQALADFARSVGVLLTRSAGVALFIDYGRAEPGYGDTLQALRGHRKESPLAHPGEADLTAHVDFPAFLAAARETGALTLPLLTQREFLRRLGVDARAAALTSANPTKADTIARQLDRLIGPEQMGELFKVACIHSPEYVAA